MPAEPSELREWLAWSNTPDCVCGHEWKSLGRLYGVSMGRGWVRMDTASDCPHHADGSVPGEPT